MEVVSSVRKQRKCGPWHQYWIIDPKLPLQLEADTYAYDMGAVISH